MPATEIRDFTEGCHRSTSAGPGGRGLHLLPEAESGEWISPVYRTSGPFDWAVASWNGDGERMEVQLRVSAATGWSTWFSFGSWSPAGERMSGPEQEVPGVGRLLTDTLLLTNRSRAWQVRVLLKGAAVRRIFVATAIREHRGPDEPDRSVWGRELAVPTYSQMIYPGGGAVWCSPTALAMVMAHWGVELSIPDQVAPGVYDLVYDGHGNWPFNTAFAGAHGLEAWVDRLPSLGDLERWIGRGVPVVCSVHYQRAWMEGAPIDLTDGHLLVVRGFTDHGDVIVNEPAAPDDAAVRMVYKREQFARAWLDRGGVVYIIRAEA